MIFYSFVSFIDNNMDIYEVFQKSIEKKKSLCTLALVSLLVSIIYFNIVKKVVKYPINFSDAKITVYVYASVHSD